MKLYEIADSYIRLGQAIENGEIPDEAIADTLESVTACLEDKADNIACLLKTLDAEINAFKEEENRLAERRRVKENAYKRLKTYLSETLLRAGMENIETTRNKISFRKSELVEVDEDTFIPWAQKNRDDLLTYSTPTFSRTEIKKALKSGDEIIGAELRINKNIQIK